MTIIDPKWSLKLPMRKGNVFSHAMVLRQLMGSRKYLNFEMGREDMRCYPTWVMNQRNKHELCYSKELNGAFLIARSNKQNVITK